MDGTYKPGPDRRVSLAAYQVRKGKAVRRNRCRSDSKKCAQSRGARATGRCNDRHDRPRERPAVLPLGPSNSSVRISMATAISSPVTRSQLGDAARRDRDGSWQSLENLQWSRRAADAHPSRPAGGEWRRRSGGARQAESKYDILSDRDQPMSAPVAPSSDVSACGEPRSPRPRKSSRGDRPSKLLPRWAMPPMAARGNSPGRNDAPGCHGGS